MAKVKINKLPEGYKIRNGKVVKTMKSGGYITGDQMRDGSYGLVTIPSQVAEGTEIGPTPMPDVRYSLEPVPRDEANIEAEKGETVLTDLDEDGNFELYTIGGKRHSKGGTPLNLPPQSFVFSDTTKLRFNRNELAEFGIESKKKMTPATVSKKYQLNPFIGVLADPNTDMIGEATAELMLDKNKMSLSQLAFAQENKKKWRDGVPLASHPYIASQGEDPIEFSMEVEELKRKEAEDAAIAQLPPELQQKALMMRAFMEQAQQQPQMSAQAQGPPAPQMQQQMPPQMQQQQMAPQGMMPPQQMMARYGGQLPTFQGLYDSEVKPWMDKDYTPTNNENGTEFQGYTDEEIRYYWYLKATQPELSSTDAIQKVMYDFADDEEKEMIDLTREHSRRITEQASQEPSRRGVSEIIGNWRNKMQDRRASRDADKQLDYMPTASVLQQQTSQQPVLSQEKAVASQQPAISFENWQDEWLDSEEAKVMIRDYLNQGLGPEGLGEHMMTAARSAYDAETRTHDYREPPYNRPGSSAQYDPSSVSYTPSLEPEPGQYTADMIRDTSHPQFNYRELPYATQSSDPSMWHVSEFPYGSQAMNYPESQRPDSYYDQDFEANTRRELAPGDPEWPFAAYPNIQTGPDTNIPPGSTPDYRTVFDAEYSNLDMPQDLNTQASVQSSGTVSTPPGLPLTYSDWKAAFLKTAEGQTPRSEAELEQIWTTVYDKYSGVVDGTSNPTVKAVDEETQQQEKAGVPPDQAEENAVKKVSAQTGQTEEEVRRQVAFSYTGIERTDADPAANISAREDVKTRSFKTGDITKAEYDDLKNKIKTYEGLQAGFKEEYKNRGAKDNAGKTSPEYDAALQDVIETAKKYGVTLEGVDLSGIEEDPGGTGSPTSNLFGKRHNELVFHLDEETFVDDKPIVEVEGKKERETIIDDPDYKVPARGDVPEWWAQDVNNYIGAVDDLWSIKERYPWMPEFKTPQMAPIYRDPTREIAAIGEQAGIAANVASTYAGPQRAAALAAKTQGLAGKQAADALSNIQGGNVGIYNQADQFNKQMDAQGQRINNKYDIDLYDRTMLTMQNADDARRAARHNVRQQWNAGTTNMWQTEALEDLYPQFNIDQGIGGRTVFNNPRDIVTEDDPKTMEDKYFDFLRRYRKYYPEADDKGVSDAWNTIYGKTGRRSKRDELANALNNAYPSHGAKNYTPNDYYGG